MILILTVSANAQYLVASNEEFFSRAESNDSGSKEMISVVKLFFDFDNYV